MNKPYKLSKDYRLLRKLLDNGNEIVCFFDGEVCREEYLKTRDIISLCVDGVIMTSQKYVHRLLFPNT